MKTLAANKHDCTERNARALTGSILAATFLTALLAVAGCEKEGPVEETLEEVDDAAESAGDELEEAADSAQDSVEDAAEEVEDEIDDATQQ